jgi:hypothetical protein
LRVGWDDELGHFIEDGELARSEKFAGRRRDTGLGGLRQRVVREGCGRGGAGGDGQRLAPGDRFAAAHVGLPGIRCCLV